MPAKCSTRVFLFFLEMKSKKSTRRSKDTHATRRRVAITALDQCLLFSPCRKCWFGQNSFCSLSYHHRHHHHHHHHHPKHNHKPSIEMATIQEVLEQVAALPTAPKPYQNPYAGHRSLSEHEQELLGEYARLADTIRRVRFLSLSLFFSRWLG